jgi:hypothetical protein
MGPRAESSMERRRTVAIERAADGTVLWWMTVWTGTTPSGVEVFCHATQASGHSCVPDHNVVLRNPVQIDGFSMHAPSALMFLANSDVTSLRAVIDDAEPVEINLADIGVSSGKQTAGLYLGDREITTIRFDATLTDGSTYSFSIAAPEVTPAPTSASAASAPPEPYARVSCSKTDRAVHEPDPLSAMSLILRLCAALWGPVASIWV